LAASTSSKFRSTSVSFEDDHLGPAVAEVQQQYDQRGIATALEAGVGTGGEQPLGPIGGND
jgi:hypothetical protein